MLLLLLFLPVLVLAMDNLGEVLGYETLIRNLRSLP